jgi:hypothetical protein
MPDPAADDGPGGRAPDGTERLLGHLDSYFLVAELVAGWRAGSFTAAPAWSWPSTPSGSAST